MTSGIRIAVLGMAFALVAAMTAVHTAASGLIYVDKTAAPGGNGSASRPYNSVGDAVTAARTTGAVVIVVAPGVYPVDATLVIDHTLDLRGSSVLVYGSDGLATGAVAPGSETRIVGTPLLGPKPLINVGAADGTVVAGVRISGLVLEGPTGSTEILLTRVQGYTIQNNVFRAPAQLGTQSVASSGVAIGNYFSGVGTGAIFTGGYAASPSSVVFTGNRSVNNTLGGVLLNGASIGIPELGDQLNAVVQGNDLSGNIATQNVSFGVRLFVLRRDLGALGDSQSQGHIHAVIVNNRIVGNEMGLSIDAGFPYRLVTSAGGATTCDSRVYSGSIDLTLAGNTVTTSRLTPALVTFTRNSAALTPAQLPQWQYLHGATFTITDPQGALAGGRIDHPQADPFVGPCSADATHETLGNILRYNGSLVPFGRNF